MDFEKLLQKNHGKEIVIITKDDHHYQGQLVGCHCKGNNPYKCTHLIMVLMEMNYVDIPVTEIESVKVGTEFLSTK